MRYYLVLWALFCSPSVRAQTDSIPTIKTVLLEQLKTTHNVQEWFVPLLFSVKDLSVEQANWRDSTENHSIAELATHLYFWNKHNLDKFNGESVDTVNENKETFTPVTSKTWKTTIQNLDSVLSAWEAAVQKTDERKLQKWYSVIANISTHNAYHTGQILYIRKHKGWWDNNNGVK